MEQHNLINEKAVYAFMHRAVEKPSLTPWIIRTERATPPTIYSSTSTAMVPPGQSASI
jgi:hypothetical protein